jgi:hypothetical protein
MLLSSYSKIKVTSYNYKKLLKSYGDKIDIELDEILHLPIELLPDGSGYKVDVKCDFCNKEYSTEWRKYRKIKKDGSKDCCSEKRCIIEKRKETNISNYGVDNPMKSDKIKANLRSSIKDKWGVEHYSKTDEYKEKIKQTAIDKWGVEHYSKTDEYKTKFKETVMHKYGVDNPFKLDDVKIKIKETLLNKYGVDNFSKTDNYKKKVTKTSLSKWGVSSYSKSDECKKKVKEDNIKKWGVDNYKKTSNSLVDTIIGSDINHISYEGNKTHKFKCKSGCVFKIKSDNYLKRKNANIPICTVCNPIGELVSIKEKELLEHIESVYKGKIIKSYRDNLEIDVYLPELKIGFEFNGLYFHSDKFKDKNYHINKTNYFKDKGIRIIHIWEDDWIHRNNIIKSQINNWLGISDKIWARKCEVKFINNSKIVNKFLDENHIQGKSPSSKKIGLYYNGLLVSVMTFTNLEGRKRMSDGNWNLSRFCNLTNTNIVGGASKMLSFFVKSVNVERVISYADKDWSNGRLYTKLGFDKLYDTRPDYKYILDAKRIHKSNFKKSKTGISENELNLLKVWDCGKIKFERKIT